MSERPWAQVAALLHAGKACRDALAKQKNLECWCDLGIGSPMMGGQHSKACLEAGAALAAYDAAVAMKKPA